MANLKGCNSSSLLNYYSVKKALLPRSAQKGVKGSAISRSDKKTAIQLTNVCSTASNTQEDSNLKINYREEGGQDVVREGISNDLRLDSPSVDIITGLWRNYEGNQTDPGKSTVASDKRTFSASERATATLNEKSRKRKISSNTVEVNNASTVKMMKLTTESDGDKQNHCEKPMTPLHSEENTNSNVAILLRMGNKEAMIGKARSKLFRAENADKLKQLRESKQIIDKAKSKLADLHRQMLQTDDVKKEEIKKMPDKDNVSEHNLVNADIKVPAYQKFHAYKTQEVETSLVLPFKYRVLAEIFRNLDTVVSIMYNRHEVCYFNKVQPAVQGMQRRAFHLHHLGQIKTVFPTAYHFKQERLQSTANCQLTISPNMDCFGTETNPGKAGQLNMCISESGYSKTPQELSKNHGIQDNSNNCDSLDRFRIMKPSFMITRRNAFNGSLLDMVKQHHNAFLATLNPPLIVPEDKLIRWHPSFRVDEVPEIVSSDLPQPEEVQKYTTAKDVLTKVKGLYGPKIDNALLQVSSQSDEKAKLDNKPIASLPIPSAIVSPLKGIPLSLLEKIRAREAVKIRAEMTRDPASDLKIRMMSCLPEMARILRNLMISEKKAAVSFPHVMAKVLESYVGSVTLSELEEHLKLLTELVPEWVSIVHFRTGSFVKINKTMNFNNVVNKLESAQKSAIAS